MLHIFDLRLEYLLLQKAVKKRTDDFGVMVWDETIKGLE
jgi:hypothetical protein